MTTSTRPGAAGHSWSTPTGAALVGERPVQLPILAALLLGLLHVVVAVVGFLLTIDPVYLLVAAAMGPMLILLAPQLFQGAFDLLAPLNFIALSALFGTTLRTLYVVTVHNPTTREHLLMREPPELLLAAVVLINGSLACLVLGYLGHWPGLRIAASRLLRPAGWSTHRVRLVASVLVAAGLVFVNLYMHRLDIEIDHLGSLSEKRRMLVEDAQYEYAAMGYYLWGMSLLSYAFLLLWTDFAFSRRRLLSLTGFVTLAVGVLAAIPPFIISSRTGVLVLLVYAALVWNYGRRRLTGRLLIGVVVAALVVVAAMGALRALGPEAGVEELEITPGAMAEAVLGNRNWLDVTKTAHLMAAVPEEIEFQMGKSFLTWMVAPVPRTLWPNKPVIRVGIGLGEAVFEKESRRSGVPPGFVGELYLNFGYLGVFTGMFFLGLVLRALYVGFWPLLSTSPSALLIYVVIVFPLTFTLVTTDFSGAVIEILRSLVTLAVLLPLVEQRRRRRSTAPTASMSRSDAAVGPSLP